MEFFDALGMTIAYRDVGSGPTIVFIHNGGTSSVIWRYQLDALAAEYRCIAIDLPGFGDSPRPQRAATHGDLVAAVGSGIGQLVDGPAAIVGNCMGANIAASLAQAQPDLVDRVIAINPLTEASFSAGGIGVVHRADSIAAPVMARVRALSRRAPVTRWAGAQTLKFQLGDRGRAAKLHHDPELLATQTRRDQLPALVDVLEDMAAYGELDRRPGDNVVPTRIVWGAQNRVLSRRRSTHLGATLCAERVDVIGGCGHLVMLEHPTALNEIIAEFVS